MSSDTTDASVPKEKRTSKSRLSESDVKIAIYGGRLSEVEESVKAHLVTSNETEIYHTWVNVAAMKRLGFLFSGGVESAGGVVEIIWMFAVMLAILALFFIWNLLVFVVVILVLAVFSGGAALKYLRGTFVSLPLEKAGADRLDAFTTDQLVRGHFVSVKSKKKELSLGQACASSNRATTVFKAGIHLSLAIATLLIIVELLYRFVTAIWVTDLLVLAFFGLAFLIGIVFMDAGTIMRYRLAKRIKTAGVQSVKKGN